MGHAGGAGVFFAGAGVEIDAQGGKVAGRGVCHHTHAVGERGYRGDGAAGHTGGAGRGAGGGCGSGCGEPEHEEEKWFVRESAVRGEMAIGRAAEEVDVGGWVVRGAWCVGKKIREIRR